MKTFLLLLFIKKDEGDALELWNYIVEMDK